jgi:hypothetical protein
VNYLSTTVAAIFLGLASTQVYAGDYDFKPGLWETTTTMEVKGVPAQFAAMMKMPPQTEQECLKESDLMFKSDDECKFDRKRISAKKMLVNITCNTPEGITKGTGEINFNGNKSNGWFEMNVPQGPTGPMKMKSIYNAKYLGACK